ncbi:MAG: polyphosphate kinase 2 family protein [Gemmatimonadaceae bacterium]|nr:polyphosphate kinase 2 family protein [Gemmatimonadaceae bacterium]
MNLRPVGPRTRLTLSDRDARRPPAFGDRDAVKSLLAREVERLGHLQERLIASKARALLVVLQGRDASGKDGVIRTVFDGCNPLGVRVTSFGVPTELERSHDFLWRIHAAVPPRGYIGIFNRSHYEDVLVVRVRRLAPRRVWSARYAQINDFERMLSLNGVTILKFFLHVSREEQRERFIDRLHDPEENWKFRAGDLEDRKLWSAYTRAYRDALRKCSTPWAPWYVVPADSKTVRNYLITRVINETLSGLRLRFPRLAPEVRRLRVD